MGSEFTILLGVLKVERLSLQARRRKALAFSMNTDMVVEAQLLEAQIEALTTEIKSIERCSDGQKQGQ